MLHSVECTSGRNGADVPESNKEMNRTRVQHSSRRELESIGALYAPVIPGVRRRNFLEMLAFDEVVFGKPSKC